MSRLRLLSRHDLPPLWDGQPVTWQAWSDVRTTAAFHMPADQRACTECGTVDEPFHTAGLLAPPPGATFPVDHVKRTKSGHEYITTREAPAWPTLDLTAARCRHCDHDTITDQRDGTTWDLDASDYGPNGSTRPTPRKDTP